MDRITIKDGIRMGDISYQPGDKVVLVRRKKNGYPKALSDGVVYKVDSIENDNIIIRKPKPGINNIKVHRSYLAPISFIRNEIIKSILSED